MRIRIQEKGKKIARKLVKTASLFNFLKYICTRSIISYFWAIFYFCTTKENYHKVDMCTLFKAVSGSSFLKQLDPDPHSEKRMDRNPQQMNADPQPWCLPVVCLHFCFTLNTSTTEWYNWALNPNQYCSRKKVWQIVVC